MITLQTSRGRGKRLKLSGLQRETSAGEGNQTTANEGSSKRLLMPGEGPSNPTLDYTQEDNLVSFYDVMVAADRAVDAFESSVMSATHGEGPFVLNHRVDDEDSDDMDPDNSSSVEFFDLCTRESPHKIDLTSREVITLSSDSDESDDVQILF